MNALVGRLIAQCGFPACYLSGAAFSAGELALPDVGLFTLTELVEQARRLVRAAGIPVVVDADTGFGEALNVERTVQELEAAGAAAIQLEDQQLPKRCGHLSGKTLVEPEAMCAKIRAAAAARQDEALVIVARTDAANVSGLDEAIRRGRAYAQAGADWIFVEALADREEFARAAQEIPAPLVANLTEFGRSPLLPFTELAEWGYAAVLLPVTTLRIAMRAIAEALEHINRYGTQAALLPRMQTRQELYDLLGYADYEARDRKYFAPDEETR